jgi:hypothetical protein
MFSPTGRSNIFALATVLLLVQPWIICAAESIKYTTLSRGLIESRLGKYTGDDKQREATLRQMFVEAGCDDEYLSEQVVKGSKLPNIVCYLQGESDKVIIVGAHYDHAPEGDGVVDNWSSASFLPSLYQSLKNQRRKHSYIFIGFTDEERGEIGSRFYAQHMTKEQVAATEAMVNMDTLGLAPTEIWASHSDKRLAGVLVYIAGQLNLPVSGVNVEEVGSTDSEQFAERKIPRITIHSLTQETWNARILHTSKDKVSAIRLEDYYETYCLLAPYLAYLDQALDVAPPSPTH